LFLTITTQLVQICFVIMPFNEPTDQDFTEMVKLQIKTGAKVATLINNYNEEYGKNLQVKDYHNYSQKLNQAIKPYL
jgi:hypothetical protein